MRKETVFVTLSICLTIIAASAIVARGGPLDPPGGPVTSTMKTLDEIEPRIPINAANTPGDGDSVFRITQPGSYMLTGNVLGQPGKFGIEIASSHVTLDLKGFEVRGVVGALSGIVSDAPCVNIRIQDGTVNQWPVNGIDLYQFGMTTCRGALIERIHAIENGSTGVHSGLESVVRLCTAMSNGSNGFNSNTGCTFDSCVASDNSFDGFALSDGSVARACNANFNGRNGFSGSAIQLINCNASFNQEQGIDVAFSSVIDCYCRLNGGDGIRAWACLIEGNNCFDNALAGVHVIGSASRIEGNSCVLNARGFDIDAPLNVVIRNNAKDNGQNYAHVVAGNITGEVVATEADLQAAANASVNFSTP